MIIMSCYLVTLSAQMSNLVNGSVHFVLAGNSQEVMVPPVEGVAGGGTSYGWSDGGAYVSSLMKGDIDPLEVPSSELLNVWCMPSTANVGSQEMPRHLEPVCMLYHIFLCFCACIIRSFS